MAKYERTLTGDFQEVLSFLERTIQASGGFLHFVDGTDCDLGNTRIAVRVYDRYYMRNNSRASLTLTVVGCGNTVTVSAIGAGGGPGMLFHLDWGTEEDIVQIVEQSLERF